MATVESQFDVQPSVGNHFAWMRTMLALQRTLMAAVRTSVSLVGFGFTVAQFFDKIRDKLPEGRRHRCKHSAQPRPHPIGAGVISLSMFVWEYRAAVAHFRSGDYAVLATTEKTLHRPTYVVAFAVILIGKAAFARSSRADRTSALRAIAGGTVRPLAIRSRSTPRPAILDFAVSGGREIPEVSESASASIYREVAASALVSATHCSVELFPFSAAAAASCRAASRSERNF